MGRHALQGALILMAWAACLWFSGCAGTGHTSLHGETPMMASWYGKEQHRHLTACGQRYDMYAYTAAHRHLPLGTILEVRNPANGKSVRVTVTDRGPYVGGRDLDLSYAAARDLDMLTKGVIRVYVNEVGHDARYDHYWKNGVEPTIASTVGAESLSQPSPDLASASR